MNPTEIEFRFVRENIKALVVSDSPLIEARKFSHYDKKQLYIYDNARQIIRINGDSIELVENGTDEILFLDDRYADQITASHQNSKDSLLDDLILNQINFSKSDGFDVNEQRLLLKIVIYSFFFKDILQSRPIVAFIGPKGSGKSHLCRMLGKLVIGSKFNVNSVTTEEAYYTTVTNNALVAFDNVDGKINWLNDALAVTATGGLLEKRVLYTTNRNVKFNLDALVMINSRTPHFKRDDVADRLIIFRLDRFDNFKSGEKLIEALDQNRQSILSELIENLNGIVELLQNDGSSLPTPFRMADWAENGWKISKHFGVEEVFLRIVQKMNLSQSHFALDDDLLFRPFRNGCQQNKQNREVTASDLYGDLAKIMGKETWQFHYRSPIALGKRLSNITQI